MLSLIHMLQEVRRYLKGVTGEYISLENLYLTPDGKIGVLPEKAANLINKTKDNAKIERIKDCLLYTSQQKNAAKDQEKEDTRFADSVREKSEASGSRCV